MPQITYQRYIIVVKSHSRTHLQTRNCQEKIWKGKKDEEIRMEKSERVRRCHVTGSTTSPGDKNSAFVKIGHCSYTKAPPETSLPSNWWDSTEFFKHSVFVEWLDQTQFIKALDRGGDWDTCQHGCHYDPKKIFFFRKFLDSSRSILRPPKFPLAGGAMQQ